MIDKSFIFYSDELNFKSEETKDGKKYFVEGYISTGDLDLVNDIVTKSGLDDMANQLKDRNIKIDYEHEAFRGKSETEAQINKTTIPLGRIIESTTDNKGLKVKAELNPAWKKLDEKGNVTRTFSEIWSSIKGKFLDAFSIAYIPVKTAIKNINNTEVRLLDGINLLNVALTGNPVNPNASMTNVMAKSLEYIKEQQKGDIMAEKKDEAPADPKPAEPTEPAEPKPEGEPAKPAEPAEDLEAKSGKEILEIKSRIDSLEKKNTELEKENKELKEIMEKARVKSIGAEKKENQEIKSKGPIDFI